MKVSCPNCKRNYLPSELLRVWRRERNPEQRMSLRCLRCGEKIYVMVVPQDPEFHLDEDQKPLWQQVPTYWSCFSDEGDGNERITEMASKLQADIASGHSDGDAIRDFMRAYHLYAITPDGHHCGASDTEPREAVIGYAILTHSRGGDMFSRHTSEEVVVKIYDQEELAIIREEREKREAADAVPT